MSFHLNGEALTLIAIIVGMFLLALFCLACSLNPREFWETSCCCHMCCRRQQPTQSQDYANLNEFIFESEDHQPGRIMTLQDAPTTMEQVFPDLLGNDVEYPSNRPSSDRPDTHETPNRNATSEMSEPLL